MIGAKRHSTGAQRADIAGIVYEARDALCRPIDTILAAHVRPDTGRGPDASTGREVLDATSGRRERFRVLPPSELVMFLDDEDPEIRHFVSVYFDGAHEPLPVGAEDLWALTMLTERGDRPVYLGGGRLFRMRAASVLGRIKRPESERAILDLLDATTDGIVRVRLGVALCALCPTDPEVLDRVHDLALSSNPHDPDHSRLEQHFLALCAMQGFQPIEAFVWRARAAAREQALAAKSTQRSGGGGVDPFLLELLRGEPEEDPN